MVSLLLSTGFEISISDLVDFYCSESQGSPSSALSGHVLPYKMRALFHGRLCKHFLEF